MLQTVVEVSWEVVNKVGGIHTVVKGKADLLVDHYEEYIMVGPLFSLKNEYDFRQDDPPDNIKTIFDLLATHGIECVYGHWLIKGKPQTVLINAKNAHFDLNAIKGELWEKFQIDSMNAGYDFDEPLQWAWACGMFIEELQKQKEDTIVAHLHEWMAGFAGLYLKAKNASTATVFTTHATMLGRSISGGTSMQLYDELHNINPPEMAKRLNITEKYTTEVACAKYSDVFTTVSEITGMEAEKLLGRKPDVLLFNGIDGSKYPTMEEASVLHTKAREQIRDFLDFYFFSHYTFDLDQSLIFFTSGRYEYHNKGLDVLTEALVKLNAHLKEINSPKTVVVFYFIPGDTHGIKMELLEERSAFHHMEQYITEHSRDIIRKLLRNASALEDTACHELLTPEMREHIVRLNKGMQHDGNPPIITHSIPDEESDPIVAQFRSNGLNNEEDDKVKVIRYPIYLTGSDSLLDMSYVEVVAGSHLGIFPSYYEPWGYTPVEAAVLAIPAVTTDLAGFGLFTQAHAKEEGGVFVLERQGKSNEQAAQGLFEILKQYCALDKYGRMEQKVQAKDVSHLTEWHTFIKEYFRAHSIAYEKHK